MSKRVISIIIAILIICIGSIPLMATSAEHTVHDYSANKRIISEATCTSPAVYRYTCTGCSFTKDVIEGKPLGHNYTQWTNSTATHHIKKCYRCGQIVLNAKHIMVEASASNGVKTRTCIFCGYTEIGNSSSNSNHVHSFTNNRTLVKEATCTSAAVYRYTCTSCSLTQEKTEGSPLGHSLSATWQYDQIQHYKLCSRCNQKINGANHTWKATTSSSSAKICSVCGYDTSKAIIPGSGNNNNNSNNNVEILPENPNHTIHVYARGKTLVKEATCTEPATYRYYCIGCNLSKEIKEGNKLEHTPATNWEKDETYHYRLCTKCRYTITQEAHKFGEWKDIDNNKEQCVCSVCGYVKTREKYKPIFNHTLNGTKYKSYSDSTINVSIEKYSKFYITKVWVKDPSRQVKKVEAQWNVKLNTVAGMLNHTYGAIVGCNGSGFYVSGTWTPAEKEIKNLGASKWNYTSEGFFVRTNGDTRRAIAGKTCNTLLGILPNGSFEYFEGTPYQTVLDMGVNDTFAFGPCVIKDGKKYNQSSSQFRIRQPYSKLRHSTQIGQVDENNYIIISTTSTATLYEMQDLGLKLKCKILYDCDGGGSTTLWFRNGKTGNGANIRGGTRSVIDSLCFVSAE